ncbi:MAG: pantoate--beta-alanine ligase [Planctomycetia bacterium]|nr:pantoate--beta-alanine ligase [Planctomycetia bacterium]MCC7313249.1 pantoate--beta-alanine ligase [Planctomycetota bacterium]
MARTVAEVRGAVADARRAGRTICFVPTMGALHAGHVSLIHAAAGASDPFVVVSIYVNPKQFGPNEDFTAYPRALDADAKACAEAGVCLLFVPDTMEIYPPGDQTRVVPGPLADALCGPYRPGHFEGVCTVVARLFNIVTPDIAYFGQKDAQQAVIIRRMVEDLRMAVRIQVCPLVRDADGLALSSRNARLRPEDRDGALLLYKALCSGKDRIEAGEMSMGRVIAAMKSVVSGAADVSTDYLSVVDPDTLAELSGPQPRMMIAGAIRLAGVRLIDNILVNLP